MSFVPIEYWIILSVLGVLFVRSLLDLRSATLVDAEIVGFRLRKRFGIPLVLPVARLKDVHGKEHIVDLNDFVERPEGHRAKVWVKRSATGIESASPSSLPLFLWGFLWIALLYPAILVPLTFGLSLNAFIIVYTLSGIAGLVAVFAYEAKMLRIGWNRATRPWKKKPPNPATKEEYLRAWANPLRILSFEEAWRLDYHRTHGWRYRLVELAISAVGLWWTLF